MPILPILIPPSSVQIGLRAVLRASKQISIASVSVPTARSFSASPSIPRQPCFQYNSWGNARPFRAPYSPTTRRSMPRVHLRTLFTFRATTRYIDLPDSYTDAEGLPFRREDLNQRESNKIFPSNLPASEANRLLKILHGRRVAGTLDDPLLARNTREFRITDQKRALAYLREHIPVDEILNAGLRAEDELEIIEQQNHASEAASNGQSSPSTATEEVDRTLAGRLPKKPGSGSPYGESNFDRIRAANIAKREAEEAALKEQQRLQEEELAKGNIGTLQTQQEARPTQMSEFREYYAKRATSDLEAPPEASASQRLLPTMGMVVLVVIGSMAFAATYQAPAQSRRLWPDIPPAAATCLCLIAMNFAIYGLWRFPPAWAVLNKYFLLIPATPQPLQIIGAMFSHQSLGHLCNNMFWIWIFGTRVHDEIGRGNFLALYLSSGAVGFATSLAYFVLWRGLHITSLGASGAVYGLITAYFWIHKFDEFKILGYPHDPASGPQGLGFIALILGMHMMPLLSKRMHNIDLTSHFAGMLSGILGIELIGRYKEHKARIHAERLKRTDAVDMDTTVEGETIPPTAVDMQSSSPPTQR